MSGIVQIQDVLWARRVGVHLCETKNQCRWRRTGACVYERPVLLVQNNCLQEFMLCVCEQTSRSVSGPRHPRGVHACSCTGVCPQLHRRVTRCAGPRRRAEQCAPSPGGHMALPNPTRPTQAQSTGPFQQPRRTRDGAGQAGSVRPGPKVGVGRPGASSPRPQCGMG